VVSDRYFTAQHLDFTRGKLRVGCALGAQTDQSGDSHAEFIADALGSGESLLIVRVDHDLGQACAIAQVDENDAPMVAAAMNPAKQGDCLVKVLFTDLAGVAGTHRG
jgi:hypothetical protein